MELIFGRQCRMKWAENVARTSWITDPVHPSLHAVAKITLQLIGKMANYSPVGGGGANKHSSSQEMTEHKRSIHREESSEDERSFYRTERSGNWREQGRGKSKPMGGQVSRGGQGSGGHGGRNRHPRGIYYPRTTQQNHSKKDDHNPRFTGGSGRGGGGGGYDRRITSERQRKKDNLLMWEVGRSQIKPVLCKSLNTLCTIQ
jgi:hypothetical protein